MTRASIALLTRRPVVRAALVAAMMIVVAVAAGAAGSSPGGDRDDDHNGGDEIRSFEEACNKAYETNDLKAYFDCYWDDMTQFYQQGRLDLPEYRKVWGKEIADGGGIVEIKLADMVIHVAPSNDAAVAGYRIFAKQRHPDGTITEGWNDETDVLFRRGGRWKIVHLHYSDAPKSTAGQAPTAGDSASRSPAPRR